MTRDFDIPDGDSQIDSIDRREQEREDVDADEEADDPCLGDDDDD